MLNQKFYANSLLIFSFACTVLSTFYAAYVHRPLMFDGSAWYYNILAYQYYFDVSYARYFTLILEFPATFLLTYFPSAPHWVVVRSLDIMLAAHPLISVYFCFRLLKKKNKLVFLQFPLLSFGTATLSTIAFGVGIVPESLSLFWPIFLLLYFRDESQWKDSVYIFILMICLCFTYEMSLIFFGVFFVVQLFRIKKNQNFSEKIFLLFSVLGSVFCLYRIIGPTHGSTVHFWESVWMNIGTFRKYCAAMIMGYFLLIFSLIKVPGSRIPKIVFLVFFILAIFCLWVFNSPYLGIGSAYQNRIFAIPFAAVISFGMLFLIQWKQDAIEIEKILTGLPSFFLSMVLFCSSVHDFKLSQMWNEGMQKFYKDHSSNIGCNVDYGERPLILGWYAPFLSIFSQNSKKITWIVFADEPKNPFPHCEYFGNQLLEDPTFRHELSSQSYFDFSPAIEATQKQLSEKRK